MTIAGPVVGEVAKSEEPSGPRRRRNRSLHGGEGRRAAILIAPTIGLLLLIVGYPIVKAIYQSFLSDPGLDKATGIFTNGGNWAGVANYKRWLLDQCPVAGGGTVHCAKGALVGQFYNSLWVTVLFAIVTVVLETAIGMGFAIMMHRAFRGRSLVRAAILIPWAIPTVVTAKLWTVVFDPEGILNHLLGTHYAWTSSQWPARSAIIIADVWKTTPFIALLILAGLQGISAEIYESAKIDGANAWQRFRLITLPLVKPALAVAVIFRTLDVLRMYDLVKILTNGTNGTQTISVLVVNQINSASGLNLASALSTLTFIFIFAISLLLVRLFNANIVGAQAKGVK